MSAESPISRRGLIAGWAALLAGSKNESALARGDVAAVLNHGKNLPVAVDERRFPENCCGRRSFAPLRMTAPDNGMVKSESGGTAQIEPDIRVLVPNTLLGSTAQLMSNAFAEETGAAIAFIPQPPESIEFLLREDVRTGTNRYQAAVVPMWHIGGFVVDSVILPLGDLIAATGVPDQSQLAEFASIASLRSFEGEQFAVAIDGDCQLLYFQQDALESEELASSYISETGRSWTVPQTWQDLVAMATWWESRGQHGAAIASAPASMAVFPFLGIAASYATPADDPGLFWFGREAFRAQIASESHQRALQTLAALVATGDPAQQSWYAPQAWSAFLDGDALFTIAGPDLLTSAIDQNHARRDRIGVAFLPSADNDSADAGTGLRNAGNVLGPNWGGVVQHNASNPELALRAVAMLANPAFQVERGWVVDDGIDPSRPGQLPDEGEVSLDRYIEAGFTPAQAAQFGPAVEQSLHEPVQLPFLRIPGAFDYLTILDRAVTSVLSGGQPAPREALEAAAAAFDDLSEIHGVERQQSLYWGNLD